jgi:hypothetical protein
MWYGGNLPHSHALPRSFVLHCLNVNLSSVNRRWAAVSYRYPWALRHPRTCPPRLLGNGLWVKYRVSGANAVRGVWVQTVAGPWDRGECPTQRPTGKVARLPAMPRRVGRDMLGRFICP